MQNNDKKHPYPEYAAAKRLSSGEMPGKLHCHTSPGELHCHTYPARTNPADATAKRLSSGQTPGRLRYHTSPGAYKSWARPISFLLGFFTRFSSPSR